MYVANILRNATQARDKRSNLLAIEKTWLAKDQIEKIWVYVRADYVSNSCFIVG